MNIMDIFLIAEAIGKLEKYFKCKLFDNANDFLELPSDYYAQLDQNDQDQKWFIIHPEKLNNLFRQDHHAFIVSEHEKGIILKAFQIVEEYTADMPENTHFKERLLRCKQKFPSVFFKDSKTEKQDESCKIIPFKHF